MIKTPEVLLGKCLLNTCPRNSLFIYLLLLLAGGSQHGVALALEHRVPVFARGIIRPFECTLYRFSKRVVVAFDGTAHLLADDIVVTLDNHPVELKFDKLVIAAYLRIPFVLCHLLFFFKKSEGLLAKCFFKQ